MALLLIKNFLFSNNH